MRHRPLRPLTVVLFTLGLAGVACGGGDDDPLTQAELVREANIVCQDADSDVESAFAELPQTGEPSPEDIQAVIIKLLPLVEGVSDDLADLEPPADVKDRYDEAIGKLREGNTKVRDAGKSPEAASTIFASEDDPYDDANKIFDDLGMTDCGGGDAAEPAPTPTSTPESMPVPAPESTPVPTPEEGAGG